jgi:hypothetical protein
MFYTLISQVQQNYVYVFWSLHSCEVEGEKGSGDTSTIDVQTLLEALLKTSMRSACFTDEAFSGKKQNNWSWDYCLQVTDYPDF